jgi:hypothetical protein
MTNPETTAMLVRGRWKPPQLKGERTTMFCLFDRRSGLASVSEAPGWAAR